MGLTAPHSLRLAAAWASGLKDRGPWKGDQQGLITCLELWVHCLVVCETSVCGRGRFCPGLQLRPRPRPPCSSGPHPPPAPPSHLQPPSHLRRLSLLSSGTLAHTFTCIFFPCPPLMPPPGSAALALPVLSLLSPVLSLLPLQLPADRVRQVRPVLRAPGPPSTSNQIPSLPRRLPCPSLPGRLLCDPTVAPKAPPFICDLVYCSGELTHPA